MTAPCAICGTQCHVRQVPFGAPFSDAYCDGCAAEYRRRYKPKKPDNEPPGVIEQTDELNEPTERGKRNYDDGLFEGVPCICTEECPADCKGQCGCEACSNAYSDFLSCE